MATTTDASREPAMPDGTPHRIDFDTFVRLGELGMFPARAELVDGIVYDMRPKGRPALPDVAIDLAAIFAAARTGRPPAR